MLLCFSGKFLVLIRSFDFNSQKLFIFSFFYRMLHECMELVNGSIDLLSDFDLKSLSF